jgi:hypothetical protein
MPTVKNWCKWGGEKKKLINFEFFYYLVLYFFLFYKIRHWFLFTVI